EMEHCVNECRGGMLEVLKKEWPTIKPDEYRLMVYLASNLSNRTIAILIGESIEVVYKRKSRLKAKLGALDLPDGGAFLSVF
ncbi:MAG: helix-turn-helix transcriptional regulator, partial [Muribaculaceae bacterium]|nr:helix-turn-helix transcriptional regulator [Muribaculaceae bacterium]